MRPYVRVRMLTREEYEEPKRMERRRRLAADKVKRAKIILLSNQDYLLRLLCRPYREQGPASYFDFSIRISDHLTGAYALKHNVQRDLGRVRW